jgi:hypothetical protein
MITKSDIEQCECAKDLYCLALALLEERDEAREQCAKACDAVARKHEDMVRGAKSKEARNKHWDIMYGASTCAAEIRSGKP